MPPNRKTEMSVNDLPTWNVASSSKTLAQEPAAAPNNNNHASYWDWPADDCVAELEKIANLLSAAHIQENLLRAAATQQEEKQPPAAVSNDSDDASSYWDMPATEPKPSEVPAAVWKYMHLPKQHPHGSPAAPRSYWDFPADTHDAAAADRVLERQRARQLTSTATIQAHLVQSQETASSSPLPPAHDAYWVF